MGSRNGPESLQPNRNQFSVDLAALLREAIGMAMRYQEESDRERFYYLSGVEYRDIDALEEMLDGTDMKWTMFEPNPSNEYVMVTDKITGEYRVYSMDEMVRLHSTEDDGETIWYLS